MSTPTTFEAAPSRRLQGDGTGRTPTSFEQLHPRETTGRFTTKTTLEADGGLHVLATEAPAPVLDDTAGALARVHIESITDAIASLETAGEPEVVYTYPDLHGGDAAMQVDLGAGARLMVTCAGSTAQVSVDHEDGSSAEVTTTSDAAAITAAARRAQSRLGHERALARQVSRLGMLDDGVQFRVAEPGERVRADLPAAVVAVDYVDHLVTVHDDGQVGVHRDGQLLTPHDQTAFISELATRVTTNDDQQPLDLAALRGLVIATHTG